MKLATSAVGSTGVEVSAALHVFVKRALYLFSSGAELELERRRLIRTAGAWYGSVEWQYHTEAKV